MLAGNRLVVIGFTLNDDILKYLVVNCSGYPFKAKAISVLGLAGDQDPEHEPLVSMLLQLFRAFTSPTGSVVPLT